MFYLKKGLGFNQVSPDRMWAMVMDLLLHCMLYSACEAMYQKCNSLINQRDRKETGDRGAWLYPFSWRVHRNSGGEGYRGCITVECPSKILIQ
jgi:hypothetical protein